MFGTKVKTNEGKIRELLERRFDHEHPEYQAIFPSREEAEKRLKSGKKLRVYLGIDPTGPELHLGHTIPLLFLKQLQELGHEPVLVIGDFTAKIGDPSGKSGTRKPLSEREIENNLKTYLSQVYKIIPKKYLKYYRNSSWLSKLSISEFMVIASKISMHYMATRSMFRERLAAGEQEKPFAVHEFLYPLMQGYDSVAMEIDGEVGGSDQTFNMLIGRDLEKKLLNKDKLVFATRLLVDASSRRKMSKSEGGLISLSDSPKDMYGKTMATVPDEMIATVFELCTEKDAGWIEENKKSEPMGFKKQLAFELVRMYHGEKEAQKAKDEWERVFSKREYPSEMKEVKPEKLVELVGIVMQGSSSSAKILIDQGAVRVNGEIKKEWNFMPEEGDVVQIGPKTFVKIK